MADKLNGDAHNGESESSVTAVPKHLAERKQSSSRKFKISTVASVDDPLFNPDAVGSAATLPRNDGRLSSDVIREITPSEASSRVEPEGSGGESEFQSLENIRKPRSSSVVSNNDQRYYSIEDVDQAGNSSRINSTQSDRSSFYLPESSPEHVEVTIPGRDGVARPGPIIHYSRRVEDAQMRFDDSFCKKATVNVPMAMDKTDNTDAVTDIFVPVPNSQPLDSTLHETITSAYETNISINKLLKERHKGSLAAMGRLFGSKQREAEKQTAASMLSASVAPPPKKKKACRCLRPIHFCLTFTVIVIISAAVITLQMMQSSREHESALSGYHFNYKTRELLIYPWTDSSYLMSEGDEELFKAHVGVNFPSGAPFNCSGVSRSTNRARGSEIGCYKWHEKVTLRLSTQRTNETGLCVYVDWETESYDPVLEDCINLTTPFGYWFGGHIKGDTFPLGHKDINMSLYLPGKVFGSMAERFWISSRSVAVVASHDFPLHLRIESGNNKKLCLSSWSGYKAGPRRLRYAVCRATSLKPLHKMVMQQFYRSDTYDRPDTSLLSAPIFSTSTGRDISTDLHKLSYSYILQRKRLTMFNETVGQDQTFNATSSQIGLRISPYVFLSDYLSQPDPSDMWIQSTDMNVPRLFNKDGKQSMLLNASYADLPFILPTSIQSDNLLVFVTDLASGDIHGQDFYAIDEAYNTFQPYIENFLAAVFNVTQGPIMSSVVSAHQGSAVIVYLPQTDDLSEAVRQVLHSSLMGYNLFNPGEISGSLSTEHFIRTLQFALFMPVIQISDSALHHFNNATTLEIWEKCNKARRLYGIEETILNHIESNSTNPLYTPVWWHDIKSDQYHLYDQFIFNEIYLVVPIVNSNSTSRTVYFPHGFWSRLWILSTNLSSRRGVKSVFQGPKTELLTDVGIDDMLVFEYIQPSK